MHSLSLALSRDTGSIQIPLWPLKHFKHACLYMQNVKEVHNMPQEIQLKKLVIFCLDSLRL